MSKGEQVMKYPTVNEETLEQIVEIFKKNRWTYASEDKFPTKEQIKDALNEKIKFLIDEPDVDWISGARMCVVRHTWSKTQDLMICVELEELGDLPIHSLTSKVNENEKTR